MCLIDGSHCNTCIIVARMHLVIVDQILKRISASQEILCRNLFIRQPDEIRIRTDMKLQIAPLILPDFHRLLDCLLHLIQSTLRLIQRESDPVLLADSDQELFHILWRRLRTENSPIDQILFDFLCLDDVNKTLMIKKLVGFAPMISCKAGKIIQIAHRTDRTLRVQLRYRHTKRKAVHTLIADNHKVTLLFLTFHQALAIKLIPNPYFFAFKLRSQTLHSRARRVHHAARRHMVCAGNHKITGVLLSLDYLNA